MKQSDQSSIKSEDTILPLGSVVRTKRDPGTLLVIIARAPLTVMNGTTGYFDYGAVQFPYGMTYPAKTIFFNRPEVTEKVFMGYINAEEQSYERSFDEVTKSTDYPHLHL